jgi:hypothetical protein
LLERYYDQTSGVLTRPVLLELLKRTSIDPAKFILFEEIFDQAVNTPISDHEFKFSIDALKEDLEHHKMGETIVRAFDILEKGVEEKGETIKGLKPTKEFLYAELGNIDKLSGLAASAPEGDMMLEGESFFQDYLTVKHGEGPSMCKTGINTIDSTIGGIAYGDLALIAGFTSQGKSQFCAQLSWYTAVKEGKSVYYATSETVRKTIIRRIVSRHSREDKFECPEGLDSQKIKMGTLSPQEEKIFKAVLDDLQHNKDYGRIFVSQIPRGATMSYVEARLRRQHQQHEIDMTVWDYLNLLKPDQKRNSQREEANDLLKDAKTLAASFADGRGIAFVSPWQVSREKFEYAQQNGFYTIDSMSDTSEAEKSADLIFALLRFNESKNKAKFQTLKCRDGAIPPQVELDIDFRSSYLGEQSSDGFQNMSGFLA